jgi:hypothetical protein
MQRSDTDIGGDAGRAGGDSRTSGGIAESAASSCESCGAKCRASDGDPDAEVVWLMATFARHGGVRGGDEVADLMRPFVDQPVSRLARWIVSREIVTIVRSSVLLVPMFQFDTNLMELRLHCREAVRELSGAMVDEDVALWFAVPNAWLGGAPPVEVLERDPDGVVAAARADRFIRCGW